MITVNGDPMDWTDGMTVADLLERRRFIFRMLVVNIDGRLIKRRDYAITPVPDGATVEVIHMMSGG